MSEKIIVLHPENQPEVDIYPIIKEGSIPNSVIDNQKIKSRTIINSNIALNTLKYEVLHTTLKELIDSKITQSNMENYLTSYYYNVEETQQYVGSEINTLHQTIQNEFYSNTAIDNMLMEKTDLSLFRQYLPSTYLNLDKQQDNQTSILNLHANGSIFLTNSGNKTNSGNYYLPNSIAKTEDAINGYYVLSTTNDDYQSLYNLGAYDKIVTNDDGTYTITRQTGYLTINAEDITGGTGSSVNSSNAYVYTITKETNALYDWDKVIGVSSNGFPIKCLSSTWCRPEEIGVAGTYKTITIGFSSVKTQSEIQALCPISIQYKLTTSYTEKVEKNHYAAYNQDFILEHNKSEAERSATEGKVVHEKELDSYRKNIYTTSLDANIIYNSSNYYGYGITNTPTSYGNLLTFQYSNKNDIPNFAIQLFLDQSSNIGDPSIFIRGSTSDAYTSWKKLAFVSDIPQLKTINGNSIIGSGDLRVIADGVYTKVTEGVNYYDLEWGKTYKIKMNSDNYAYCNILPDEKFYGTFEITNFTIRYSDQGSGVGVVGPEYDYIFSVSGKRYLSAQGQDVKRGASATTHSKPPIRLSAYGGSTFAVYLLN